MAGESGHRELGGRENSVWSGVDVHVGFAAVVKMTLMLAMEAGWKGEFGYVLRLVVYEELNNDLVGRHNHRNR